MRALPCRRGRRGSEEPGVRTGWEEGGRSSEEHRHQIPERDSTSGRVVPAEPGQGVGAPKSLGDDARNDRGPSPKDGHGMRGRDPDAVMLRSAEADPHITEHPLCRTPKRPSQQSGNCPAVPEPKHRCRGWAIEPPPGTG